MPTEDKRRRRGPRKPSIPNTRGDIKRSFYIPPEDYKAFWEACEGQISETLPRAIAT